MPDELFQLMRERSANVIALKLPGHMDSNDFDRLNEQLLSAIGAEPQARWVLDMTAVSYMGSSALGLMVNVRQRVKQAAGRLVLCGLSPQMLQIFQTCCMERLFTITRTRADALKLVGQ